MTTARTMRGTFIPLPPLWTNLLLMSRSATAHMIRSGGEKRWGLHPLRCPGFNQPSVSAFGGYFWTGIECATSEVIEDQPRHPPDNTIPRVLGPESRVGITLGDDADDVADTRPFDEGHVRTHPRPTAGLVGDAQAVVGMPQLLGMGVER